MRIDTFVYKLRKELDKALCELSQLNIGQKKRINLDIFGNKVSFKVKRFF